MRNYLIILFLLSSFGAAGQAKKYNSPGAGNPILPGYFADPTIKKFGDTFYIYATTDGNGGGFGPSQVWSSKDFVNWSLQDMNWPTTHHYWAPDVTQARDGRYYMYYCQPVEIFGASASSPVGPWTPLLPEGEPVVKNFLVPNVITLDGQTFRDDDGKMYFFWGTWGIYPHHGCGVGLFNSDMKSFAKLDKIPNTIAKDFFEAPFMFKRNGIYYLTYSSGRCEDDTYRVQYAVSKTGPMGPFEYGKNNPILVTTADGSVHGPGHQSVLQNGKDFFLIYHRHNNPHSGGGYHRQVAADQLVFDQEGNIEKMKPGHEGPGYLGKNENPHPDLMLGAKVTASSTYNDDFRPEYAVDNNNGTLWKPKNNTSESWLSLDLGAEKQIRSIHTQFEYATWYYQYLIESSLDGKNWSTYADRRDNTVHGSPMIDIGNVRARYIRLSILNTEYPGLNKAVWNIKAFETDSYQPKIGVKAKSPSALSRIQPTGLLLDLNVADLEIGAAMSDWKNLGKLGGEFVLDKGISPTVDMLDGRKAIIFSEGSSLLSDIKPPNSMLGNSSFTVSAWVYNPSIQDEEPIISWTRRGGIDLTNASIGYGSNKRFGAAAHWGWPDMAYQKIPEAGKWHHIAVVFDGTYEKLYVDGKLDHQELKMLFIANLSNFALGTNGDGSAFFSGALASLKVYDTALTEAEVILLAEDQGKTEIAVSLDAAKLPYGIVNEWKNEGYLQGGIHMEAGDVVDMYGKIALKITEKNQLRLSKQLSEMSKGAYTVVAVLAGRRFGDERWHQVIRVHEARESRLYVDGVLNRNKSIENLLLPGDPGSWQADGIASIMALDDYLNATSIQERYVKWKSTLPLQTQVATFEKKPLAMSPGLAIMSAAASRLPGKILQYSYTAVGANGELRQSGWLNRPQYFDFGVAEGQSYQYKLKIRDNYGNVTLPSAAVKVETARALFKISHDDFSKVADYLKGTTGSVWTGIEGKADSLRSGNQLLHLSSTDTKWDGNEPQGPFLYQKVDGDFIAQAEVADVSGLISKTANGANDVGLMLRPGSPEGGLIQNSIFPGWGVGNMVTDLNRRGRFQFNNASAWNFYRHLQVQRIGNVFYLRGSSDGRNWKDLPGSPLERPDWSGKSLQVGLYQCTYGKTSGYGAFRSFSIYQNK